MTSQDEQGLIEPDGVNAGTSDVEDETLHPAAYDADQGRAGGDPEGRDDAPAQDAELLGPPPQDESQEPGQELSVGEG
jgi:hypothetical protein